MSSDGSRIQLLVLERRDPQRNMARYYVLSIEPTLFEDFALVREWGRLGTRGRRRLDLYRDEAEAAEALEDWLARKTRRGYRHTGGPVPDAAPPSPPEEAAPRRPRSARARRGGCASRR